MQCNPTSVVKIIYRNFKFRILRRLHHRRFEVRSALVPTLLLLRDRYMCAGGTTHPESGVEREIGLRIKNSNVGHAMPTSVLEKML